MNIWTKKEEAEHLSARFKDVNKAKFAREHAVPGGASIISQHISMNRPISLEAASAYARGFNCSLAEISPRLALEVNQAFLINDTSNPIPLITQSDWITLSPKTRALIEEIIDKSKDNGINDDDIKLLASMLDHLYTVKK